MSQQNKKTYSDACLEWVEKFKEDPENNAFLLGHLGFFKLESLTMIPELARRLRKACCAIREIKSAIENTATDTVWMSDDLLTMSACDYAELIADELEAMPEEEEK